MKGHILSGLLGAGTVGGGLAYASRRDPKLGKKLTDLINPPPPEPDLVTQSKDMFSKAVSSEHTPKVLAALALAGMLGYGGFKMGENNKMKQLERAALGIR